MEKQAKGFEKVVDEWKNKCDNFAIELDASRRDIRNMVGSIFRFKRLMEDGGDAAKPLHRKNKTLARGHQKFNGDVPIFKVQKTDYRKTCF